LEEHRSGAKGNGQPNDVAGAARSGAKIFKGSAQQLTKMNRKKTGSNVRFGPALKAVLICLITCGLGLGYVWQKQQINTLGGRIKENELNWRNCAG